MTRTNVAVTEIKPAGTAAATPVVGTADGLKFKNDGRVVLRVRNTEGAEPNILTAVTTVQVSGFLVEDLAVTVLASGVQYVGPFQPSLFNQPSGADKGYVYLNFADDQADLTVEAYRLS
jgi:hypothetical protein